VRVVFLRYASFSTHSWNVHQGGGEVGVSRSERGQVRSQKLIHGYSPVHALVPLILPDNRGYSQATKRFSESFSLSTRHGEATSLDTECPARFADDLLGCRIPQRVTPVNRAASPEHPSRELLAVLEGNGRPSGTNPRFPLASVSRSMCWRFCEENKRSNMRSQKNCGRSLDRH